jgi:hypothetical protein
MYKKQKIPKALREAVWIKHCGKVFERRCFTPWCQNEINAFNFQTAHNIPESKGGSTAITNLIPLCSRCNLSMGNQYTFSQWAVEFKAAHVEIPKRTLWKRFVGLFRKPSVSPTASY